MPRTAVIIPAYNHGHYIADTLRSALGQSRAPDRVIVLDDGSSDDTAEVARSLEGVEVETQENAGAHNALNRLVAKASEDCEVIAILNSDDLFHPDRLARCLALLDEGPARQVVSTGLRLINDDGAALPDDHPRARWFSAAWSVGDHPNITLPEWLGAANFIATTSNVVARADYLKAHPFRPYRFNHDYRLLAEAAIDGVLALEPEPLLDYRVHATNTITSAPEPLVREMVRMHLDLYRDLGGKDLSLGQAGRLADFARASWDNVSALHPGHLQLGFARLLSGATDDQIAEAVAALPAEGLDHFPNRALVNAHEGEAPLSATSGLATKHEALRAKADELQDKSKAAAELAKLRAQLLGSKWVALGRLLGPARSLTGNDGKTPADKLAKLRAAIEASAWLKTGRSLGSKTAADLRTSSD